jgi:hypothetical protein
MDEQKLEHLAKLARIARHAKKDCGCGLCRLSTATLELIRELRVAKLALKIATGDSWPSIQKCRTQAERELGEK